MLFCKQGFIFVLTVLTLIIMILFSNSDSMPLKNVILSQNTTKNSIHYHYVNDKLTIYAQRLKPYQRNFIQSVVVSAIKVNKQVLTQRYKIIDLFNQSHISYKNLLWLKHIAIQYEVKNFSLTKNKKNELLTKVNFIPLSLITAQAIEESNWGRSRFAKEAKNFFGQRCFIKRCGIFAKKDTGNHYFAVKKFNSLQDSIQGYVKNLNTNFHYAYLRKIRSDSNATGKIINSYQLILSLSKYSTNKLYIHNIKEIIKLYQLQQLDKIILF